jgi:glycosyltransferase involved in cell wall biosynthesis
MDRNGLRVLAWPGLGARRTNPYTWLLYSHLAQLGVRVREFSVLRALRGNYDVLHAHWPEKALNATSWAGSLAGAAAAIATLSAAHLHGARVVWTAHNARPHESLRPRLERWFWSAFTRRVDAVIHLSAMSRHAVEAQHPVLATRPHAVVPHGHLRGIYPDTVSRREARASFGIPEGVRVIAFFGMVRSYKNVPHLIRTFRVLPSSLGEMILLVAGAPRTPALADEVRAAAEADPRVRLTLEHVPEPDVQRYLRAADLVVLPFTEVTNSGSALLALSFDRRVLVPHHGAMGELRESLGADWVCTYEGDLTPEVLANALDWALHRPTGPAPRLEALEWPPIARRTLSLYGG